MGGDSPAVGDDFKYSSGLTTAGACVRLGRGGTRNCRPSLSAPSSLTPSLPSPPSPYLTEATELLAQYGRNELEEKKQSK